MSDQRHPNHRPQASLPLSAPDQRAHTGAGVDQPAGGQRRRRCAPATWCVLHRRPPPRPGRRTASRAAPLPVDRLPRGRPDAPHRELDALRFATAADLPVPEVLAADPDGHDVGDGIPLVAMTRLAGRAVAVPDLRLLAEAAAAVQDTKPDGSPHEYFPWYADTTTEPPPLARRPALWETALTVWHTEMPDYHARFIHRDFHPGNVLWLRGSCSGIVDWASACRRPAGCDVAHCRENLTRLAGERTADAFQAAYERITGTTHHPYWEIASTLEHGPSRWTHESITAAETRLMRALGQLGLTP